TAGEGLWTGRRGLLGRLCAGAGAGRLPRRVRPARAVLVRGRPVGGGLPVWPVRPAREPGRREADEVQLEASQSGGFADPAQAPCRTERPGDREFPALFRPPRLLGGVRALRG